MRILVFTILFISSSLCYGQKSKELDVIVTIDDNILNTLESLRILIEYDNGDSISIMPEYYPGSLLFTEDQFNKVKQENVKKLFLSFSYTSYLKDKPKGYNYKIAYGKKWLDEKFTILSIKNLRTKKDRRRYEPISKGLNYSASVDFGYYSIVNLKQ